MKYLVTGYAVIRPTIVVEADSEEEAIEKAWDGENITHTLEDAHLDSANFCRKSIWRAEEIER